MTQILRFVVGSMMLLFTCAVAAQVPTDYVERSQSLTCLNERFSLRVHVIAPDPKNSSVDDANPEFDLSVFQALVDTANLAFEPICVSFEVCDVIELENYRYAVDSSGRVDERRGLFTDPNRIDVFVTVRKDRLALSGTTFNGVATCDSARIDVPRRRIVPGSKALQQELGRYFGLYYTFEREANEFEYVDGDECEIRGDLVCDTPADPFVVNSGLIYVANDDPCRISFRRLDPRGQFYVPHTANAMSFYADECNCGYTAGQLQRMADNHLAGCKDLW